MEGKETPANKQDVRFIHITKTGGTSIENTGKELGLEWGMFDKKLGSYLESVGCWWHLPFLSVKDPPPPGFYHNIWFTVVRNPYTRVVSEYFCPWKGFRATNCKLWSASEEPGTARHMNAFILHHLRLLKEYPFPTFWNDGHFLPQHLYVPTRFTSSVAALRFENLGRDFSTFCARAGLGHVNLERRDHDMTKRTLGVEHLHPDTLRCVADVYAQDFERFGYQPLVPALPKLPTGCLPSKSYWCVLTRCRREPALAEFCEYYLAEGADHVFVLWDTRREETNPLAGLPASLPDRVTVLPDTDTTQKRTARAVYQLYLRQRFQWVSFLDADEFVVPKRRPDRTVRETLMSEFETFDQVHVPWVMMACNGREEETATPLLDLTWRWDHDREHTGQGKFRCRLKQIETKPFVRCAAFGVLGSDHCASGPVVPARPFCVDSVDKNRMDGDRVHDFRERDIASAHLVCYHYRIQSLAACRRKLRDSAFYTEFSEREMMAADNAELEDNTLRDRRMNQIAFSTTTSRPKWEAHEIKKQNPNHDQNEMNGETSQGQIEM